MCAPVRLLRGRCGGAQFSQVWVNATETHTQEQAVMDAILTKGPMTVSVNAEVMLSLAVAVDYASDLHSLASRRCHVEHFSIFSGFCVLQSFSKLRDATILCVMSLCM